MENSHALYINQWKPLSGNVLALKRSVASVNCTNGETPATIKRAVDLMKSYIKLSQLKCFYIVRYHTLNLSLNRFYVCSTCVYVGFLGVQKDIYRSGECVYMLYPVMGHVPATCVPTHDKYIFYVC